MIRHILVLCSDGTITLDDQPLPLSVAVAFLVPTVLLVAYLLTSAAVMASTAEAGDDEFDPDDRLEDAGYAAYAHSPFISGPSVTMVTFPSGNQYELGETYCVYTIRRADYVGANDSENIPGYKWVGCGQIVRSLGYTKLRLEQA